LKRVGDPFLNVVPKDERQREGVFLARELAGKDDQLVIQM